MPRAQFAVKGLPAPKGSRSPLGGNRSKESSAGCKPWVETIIFACKSERPGKDPLEAPYKIGLRFVMPRPAKPKYEWPSIGDIDKLERAVLDGLTQGGLIVDDRHVVQLDTSKEFVEDGKSTGVSIVVL